MARIGVFVCHCGENIARTVDVERVAREAAEFRGVAHSVDYRYMCSDPGQRLIQEAIREKNLTSVVVAACSPHMHENTFRQAAATAGLNPYRCEIANIREQCSWVHEDREAATAKAIDLVRATVERVRRNEPLQPIRVPVTKRALVIGGGIAGIQAALDIAEGGCEVVLVERQPSIGGHMAQLSETFPTLDCSQCILTPRMVEVKKHPNIKLYTYSEVEKIEGFLGNFDVTIRRKARYVDEEKCTGCGLCQEKCAARNIPSEFERGLGTRRGIYIPFPQAVPNVPVIDTEHCFYFQKGRCGLCQKICAAKAVDYSQQDTLITERFGAIVVATGYDLAPRAEYAEYGQGQYPDVIDGLQFERLLSASGPTNGRILRPSDGKEVKSIVFVSCVGSRDPAHGRDYCSKICCMYTAKHAMLYKHKVHDGRAYVFYMDIRAGGKNYEEFVRRAIEQEGAVYLRGRVSRIYQDNGQLVVKGADTLSGAQVEIEADMVVLATAVVPQADASEMAQKLSIAYDGYGFMSELHPKLRPVETSRAGVFLAGACQAPKDIPDAVAQASAAAAKVLSMFSTLELEREPLVASVDERTCVGCFECKRVCPAGAIEERVLQVKGRPDRIVAYVNPGVCTGCGTCTVACRSRSIELAGFTDTQIYAQIGALAEV
ncbi:MAG: 4Fe-4S dicluster domain-containing protein [Armatimonadota bacterium]